MPFLTINRVKFKSKKITFLLYCENLDKNYCKKSKIAL